MPPSLSIDHIDEKISCIRAHRERIFYVGTQVSNGKLLCHNYGHGGAGWTFLFGCVHESIRQFENQLARNASLKNKPICVIGAGCYGLLTALMLAVRGYQVQIVAKETNNIPSKNAAGFFFPRPRKCSTEHEREIFRTLGLESYRTYVAISKGEHPFIKEGPKLLPAYYGLDIDPGFKPYIAQNLIEAPEEVTITFDDRKLYEVMRYHTIFINPAFMMQELWRNVREVGMAVRTREITDFDEISESIIFNCAGMGAQKLTQDPKIVPVQGHLITLKNQPSREQLHYMINVKVVAKNLKGMPRDELIYYAPKNNGILGITFLRGQADATANHHEFDRLIERCQQFFGKN